MNVKKAITKAELARELDCPRSRISQLTRQGLPVRADGRVDRSTALRWIVQFTSGHAGGWGRGLRNGAASICDRAAAVLGGSGGTTKPKVAETICAESGERSTPGNGQVRELLDLLVVRSAALPEFLAEVGCRDMVAIAGAIDIFQSILFEFAGARGDRAYDWEAGDDLPSVKHPDYEAIAKRLAVPFDAVTVSVAIDRILARRSALKGKT